MSEVQAWNPPVNWVKETIEKAGTTIGSVHFNKRSNGELRKMSYRLHVTTPSVAKAPKGVKAAVPALTTKTITKMICTICGSPKEKCSAGPYKRVKQIVKSVAVDTKPTKPRVSKKVIDKANRQMTVLDANKVVRDENGNIIGRGAWRTIPLENVTRIACKGDTYVINKY